MVPNSLSDPKYGKGINLIFDFPSLQTNLLNKLHEKKYINTNKLKGMQYQFEIFTSFDIEANPIDYIRKNIKQQDLSTKDENELKNYLKALEEESKLNAHRVIKDLYSTSASVLLELKNLYTNPNDTIDNFCSQMIKQGTSINEKFLNDSICKKPLRNVVSVHCIIEQFYFKYYSEKLLRPEFKDISQEKEIKDIITCIKRNDRAYPGIEVIRTALSKFMIRCGAGELDFASLLANYVFRDDFWPEGKLENEKKNLKEIITVDLDAGDGGEKKVKRFEIFIGSAFEFYRQLSDNSRGDGGSVLKTLPNKPAAPVKKTLVPPKGMGGLKSSTVQKK